MTPLPIRFVLVDTSHPGNIGAVARAMKNMELSDLALVRPRQFPHADALARASGAADVLARARIYATLPEALEGCGWVVACTSRERDHYYRVLDARAAATRAVAECAAADRRAGPPVAIVFGPEQSGLSNEDLAPVHALMRIPTGAEYASLNLAMAAQVVAYEIFCSRGSAVPDGKREQPLADAVTMDRLYAHLDTVLREIDFRDRTQSGTSLINRIRRFLQRAELDSNEANIVRGILTAVQRRRRRAGQSEDHK